MTRPLHVRYAFIREGKSDDYIKRHLTDLCIRHGAREVTDMSIDWLHQTEKTKKEMTAEIKKTLAVPSINLLFIHADADSPDSGPKSRDIADAVHQAAGAGEPPHYVAVIPVQEIEAWILVDEQAIRKVARNPKSSRIRLDIPSPRAVEQINDPKEKLKKALHDASELSGRRLERFKKRFNWHRRILLEGLDCEGPIRQVPAWKKLDNDVRLAMQSLAER